MASGAASCAIRGLKQCSAALKQECQVLWHFDSALQSHLRRSSQILCARAFSETSSAQPATSSSEAPLPTVRGVGLKQRLKDTPTANLRDLIRRTADYDRLLSPNSDEHEIDQVSDVPQWNRLNLSVITTYTKEQIVLKDVFAVVEAGPTQYKVVPDDKIFVHKMEGMDVDEIVQLNRVLLAGTPNNTLVGRPFVQGVQVLAAVEEQVRDATTYIYKRKRASGYRRFRGFRAELTGLRILKIIGIEQYGIDVPDWQEHVSTDLREMKSFGIQVRAQRKRARAAQRRQDTDAVVAHLESGQDYGMSSYPEPLSMPYKPIDSS